MLDIEKFPKREIVIFLICDIIFIVVRKDGRKLVGY
jgi:hypothetical protein